METVPSGIMLTFDLTLQASEYTSSSRARLGSGRARLGSGRARLG